MAGRYYYAAVPMAGGYYTVSGRWARSTRRHRLPPDWVARRHAVLVAAGWRCEQLDPQGRRCQAVATDVDHIVPGDDHDRSNLQALCGPHHRAKSSAEGVAAQPRTRRPEPPHPGP